MDRTVLQSRIRERMTETDTGYTSNCWISDRGSNAKGYTKISIEGRLWFTHRASYIAFVGEIPENLQLDHLCRQPACCNPAHLEPVTCRTNLLRGDTLPAAEAKQTHCARGHPFSEQNTYRRTDRPHTRGCVTCRNSWRARSASHPTPS